MQPLASIPSPSEGVWHLGPLPLRAYALMIILGIVVAVWVGERRWAARGGTPGVIIDSAVWAVPFGLVGGRLYHVITDYQRYFGDGRDPIDAVKVWEGGLGIWGAVVMGALGTLIACRRRGVSVLAVGDAVAPGIALAQAIGRWGNYWNQELYGRPLDTWWALKIDPDHRLKLPTGATDPRYADIATYHPTFLYESLWCVAVAILVIWAARRFTLTHGRAFALYVAAYTVGRFWIEWLRIDDAHEVLGLRLNDWTSLVVFAGAVAYLWWARDRTGPEAVRVSSPDSTGSPAASGADEPADEPATEQAPVAPAAKEAEPESAREIGDSDGSEDSGDSGPGRTAEPAGSEGSRAAADDASSGTEEAAADGTEVEEIEKVVEAAEVVKAAEDSTAEAAATDDSALQEEQERAKEPK